MFPRPTLGSSTGLPEVMCVAWLEKRGTKERRRYDTETKTRKEAVQAQCRRNEILSSKYVERRLSATSAGSDGSTDDGKVLGSRNYCAEIKTTRGGDGRKD